MAIGLENQPNIDAPDSDYPNGSIKDDTGSDDGTAVNKAFYDDYAQTWAKLMRMAAITPNGLPDNEYNGFEYILALRKLRSAGEYISYDRVATLTVSGQNNPVIKITAGAANLNDITLTASTNEEFDLGMVTVLNPSAFSIDLIPDLGVDTIEGAGTYPLASGDSVKLMQIKAENNWVIIP